MRVVVKAAVVARVSAILVVRLLLEVLALRKLVLLDLFYHAFLVFLGAAAASVPTLTTLQQPFIRRLALALAPFLRDLLASLFLGAVAGCGLLLIFLAPLLGLGLSLIRRSILRPVVSIAIQLRERFLSVLGSDFLCWHLSAGARSLPPLQPFLILQGSWLVHQLRLEPSRQLLAFLIVESLFQSLAIAVLRVRVLRGSLFVVVGLAKRIQVLRLEVVGPIPVSGLLEALVLRQPQPLLVQEDLYARIREVDDFLILPVLQTDTPVEVRN